jgi:hypothetical protein
MDGLQTRPGRRYRPLGGLALAGVIVACVPLVALSLGAQSAGRTAPVSASVGVGPTAPAPGRGWTTRLPGLPFVIISVSPRPGGGGQLALGLSLPSL